MLQLVSVDEIELDLEVPTESVRVVAMQPFIRLQEDAFEPYQWSEHAIPAQSDAIMRTLDLAQGREGVPPADFLLFPEYALPGLEGIRQVHRRLSSTAWPAGSVVVGGVHGIDREEYRRICAEFAPTVQASDSPEAVDADQWLNCCLTWVKEENGTLRRWIQLKIRSAWEERNVQRQRMRGGSTVYVFKGRYANTDGFPCRFVTFVCYDWVAAPMGRTACDEVLQQLHTRWAGNPTPLHWAFVIQHNPSPNHVEFLRNTARFLIENTPSHFVMRREAVVIHANTAASERPARRGRGGHSSCVFSPSAQLDDRVCRPTVCMQSEVIRGSDSLARCKDVVFREIGECVHRFDVRVPQWVTPDASDRSTPLVLAEVHPLSDVSDPRLPGGQVPASVKWVNDELDVIERLSDPTLRDSPLQTPASAVEEALIRGLRSGDGALTLTRMRWANCDRSSGGEAEKRRENPDVWDRIEAEALQHLLHSLTSLGIAFPMELGEAASHGVIEASRRHVHVFAIRGDTHENCRAHYEDVHPARRADPTLVVLRDHHNLRFTEREVSKIYEVREDHGLRFIAYQDLATASREATDPEDLREAIDAFIPGDRRIV